MTLIGLRGRCLSSIGLCVFGLLFGADSVSAETIASVGNPNPNFSSGILTSADEANEVSWTSVNSYQKVSISASFGQLSYANVGGLAYLMTQVGQGTTAAAQIALANFTFPNSTGGTVTLFNNLSLGPGTYYLVLYSKDPVGGGWLVSSDTTATAAAGVTVGASGYYYNPGTLKGPWFPYAPSVPFVASQSDKQFVFDVEGEAEGVSAAAPEPSSIGLLAASGLLAQLMRLRALTRVSRRRVCGSSNSV